MSRHHSNLIRSIFRDPPSGNMHWREIESSLKHVGASLEPISGARIPVRLNRMEDVLHRPHHGNVLDAKSLLHVRGFLARAGVLPSQDKADREGPFEGVVKACQVVRLARRVGFGGSSTDPTSPGANPAQTGSFES